MEQSFIRLNHNYRIWKYANHGVGTRESEWRWLSSEPIRTSSIMVSSAYWSLNKVTVWSTEELGRLLGG